MGIINIHIYIYNSGTHSHWGAFGHWGIIMQPFSPTQSPIVVGSSPWARTSADLTEKQVKYMFEAKWYAYPIWTPKRMNKKNDTVSRIWISHVFTFTTIFLGVAVTFRKMQQLTLPRYEHNLGNVSCSCFCTEASCTASIATEQFQKPWWWFGDVHLTRKHPHDSHDLKHLETNVPFSDSPMPVPQVCWDLHGCTNLDRLAGWKCPFGLEIVHEHGRDSMLHKGNWTWLRLD